MYKATPVPALLRETGWAPATTWPERIHDRFVIRVASAEPKHPLRSRWNTKLLYWIRSRQKVELLLDTITPPWLSLDRSKSKEEMSAIDREKGLMEYQSWEQSQRHNLLDLFIYTDGAMDMEGEAGSAYCIYRGPNSEITNAKIPLGRTAELFDAEIIGAVEGLKAAMTHCMTKYATNIVVCLDNEEAALRLHTGYLSPSSSVKIAEFRELRVLVKASNLGSMNCSIYLRYPGCR